MIPLLLLALALTAGSASAADRWLHVHVQGHDADAEEVHVNLPLSMIEAVLPTLEQHAFEAGQFRIGDELDGIDLRELLAAVRDAPDAEFVTVRSASETARVAKEAGFLVVHVDEKSGDRVRVRIPLEVVDALLGPDGQTIDLSAGLRRLAEFDGDLVSVESNDENVRIWIDTFAEIR